MTDLPAKIFKKYDIRGLASGDDALLTEVTAFAIGRAFATFVRRNEHRTQVVVGRDNRNSSAPLAAALIEGLCASGLNVVDLGMVATPVVYWHAVKHGDIAGVMVTGSHLAGDQNGFKVCIGSRALYGDDIQTLRQLIEADDFADGQGQTKVDENAKSAYISDLRQRIPHGRSLRVVVDPGNGVGGLFGPQLIEAWGHNVIECLNCEPDASYPSHHPNPQEAANMMEIGQRVRELNADLGIAFDGDSDRMGAVDENGQLIAADRLLALLSKDLLKRHPGAVIVADVLSSQVLFDVIRAAGGEVAMAPSGHSLVKEAMRDRGALLGGEMSGHIFLGEDFYGFDDGFLAAGRLLQVLANTEQTLSQLDASLPRLASTPEYRPHCPDESKQQVIEGVAAALKDKGHVVTVDGFRIEFERGWGLLRASNTEPVLSLRFEGQTEADALHYRDLFIEALKDYPEVAPLV